MQAKYEQLFEPLTTEELGKVYRGLVENGQLQPSEELEAGLSDETLAEACRGLDHVEIALSVAHYDDPELHAKLMRMQIARGPRGTADPQARPHRRPNGSWSTPRGSSSGTTPSAGSRAPRAPKGPPPEDGRVLVRVADNPKKSGSKAHQVYSCYQVGMSVRDFVAAVVAQGKSAADAYANLKYDAAKGFVELGSPSA